MKFMNGLRAAGRWLMEDMMPNRDFRTGDEMVINIPSGVRVTVDRARQLSAVSACIRIISETIASLPLNIHQRTGKGSEIAENHPVQTLLHDSPNNEQTALEFREMMQGGLCSRGFSIARMVHGANGELVQLIPIPQTRTTVVRTPTGRKIYKVMLKSGDQLVLTEDEVWQLNGLMLSLDNLTGLSPIEYEAAITMGAAIAAQEYSSRFFENDGKPSGVLEHPGHFSDEAARRGFRASWRNAQTGANRHATAILEDGMKYTPFTVTNDQAQFLETRKYQDVEIARIFRVPPHFIGIMDGATHSNVEQQALDFIKFCIMPWCSKWEQSINKHLLLGDPNYYAKFNLAALERADLMTRYRAYAIGRNWGWLSANDVREKEDENPIPDGDTYLQPTNMLDAADPNEPSQQGPGTGAPGRDPSDEDATNKRDNNGAAPAPRLQLPKKVGARVAAQVMLPPRNRLN